MHFKAFCKVKNFNSGRLTHSILCRFLSVSVARNDMQIENLGAYRFPNPCSYIEKKHIWYKFELSVFIKKSLYRPE